MLAVRTQCFYNLDNDLKVNYLGYTFARTYTEGGLAAHNYRWLPTSSLSRFFTRLILPTLEEKFDKIKEDDKKAQLTAQDKAETLIIEWSGANDLITVNERPSIAEADRAIAARIKNIEALVKQGYQNFVLFNLPDLSLVPRFQAASADERNNAHQCSVYFNTKLQEACKALSCAHHITFMIDNAIGNIIISVFLFLFKFIDDEFVGNLCKKMICPYITIGEATIW